MSGTAAEFRQVYRYQSLQAALHQRDITEAVTKLRSAGVEPLLIKGWAAARLYAEPGLRPFGDIDLCVRPEQYAAAEAVVRSPDGPRGNIDLHGAFSPDHVGHSLLDDDSIDELFHRSELVPLGEINVRVLGPEDHLRLLCLHMLAHGAWRPLWLCDVAAALEARPAGFDWGISLGGDPRRSDWVACALGLANRLLGAHIDDTPIGERVGRLPRWLVPTVLREWGRNYVHRGEVGPLLRRPWEALAEIPCHWPNGIEATIGLRCPFSDWPRLPFQLAAVMTRAVQFIRESTLHAAEQSQSSQSLPRKTIRV